MKVLLFPSLLIVPALNEANQVLINLIPETWYSASSTHLQDSRQNLCGLGSFQCIMTQWSGGAYDPLGNRLLIFGGGLGCYLGNEIYAFRIDDLKWERLSDPYCGATNTCQEPFPNGTPMTRHTYNQLAVITHANRFFVHGGAKNCSGTADMSLTWTFDLASKTWQRMNPTGSRPNGIYESNCTYDPVSKKVYYQSSWQGFFSYDYDANHWTQHNSITSDGETYGFVSTIDTKRRLYVQAGRGKVIVYDLKTPSLTRSIWVTSGDVPGLEWVGLAYDEAADRVVLWDGGSPYALDLDTKIWTRLSGSGAPLPNHNGTYGRWRYVPSANAFVCVTTVDENVWFYKHTAGSGTGVRGEGGEIKNKDLSLRILPNPCRGRARIQVAGTWGPSTEITIFDLRGRRVASFDAAPSGAALWEAGRAPAGVYIARARVDGKTVSERSFLRVR